MNNILKLQKWLIDNELDTYILFRTDEFLNENIAPYAERLRWISNFSGSAGKVIISQNTATIFVDGRYTFQAHAEVDKDYFSIKHIKNFYNSLKICLRKHMVIGLDPYLHSKKDLDLIEKITCKVNAEIKFLNSNPIDQLWKNQPKRPFSEAFTHPLKYSGKTVEKKILQIQSILKKNKCDYYIITSLDSIAWLLNLRGNDILYSPLNLAYVLVSQNKKIELFINKKKIKNIKQRINKIANCHSFQTTKHFIKSLSPNAIIGIDKVRTPYFFEKICRENLLKFKYIEDPCIYPKAKKNRLELNGARKANIRDGTSVTKFLYWLKNEIIINKIDEIKAANKLLSFRKNNYLFYSLSFKTISAINKNSSLPHYRVTKESNLKFKNNSIYLVDSGAQYFDGTTDITRTIILGKPTKEQKDRFTRVLKGHIAIATSSFKKGSKGSFLDPLARKSLKEINCDYDHGTGHGIGSFLNVHEGPQMISKSQSEYDGKIMEGMILSNEPGFYKKEKYGIRTENLIIVKKKSDTLLNFETISWAPIDVELIDVSLLVNKEIEWLNNYHKKVFSKLFNHLNKKEQIWLEEVTKPINF